VAADADQLPAMDLRLEPVNDVAATYRPRMRFGLVRQ